LVGGDGGAQLAERVLGARGIQQLVGAATSGE
jgi:hypothetical protein